ncbi:hypothetical protein LOAG_12900 [Loa loa]|uniref:BHLH domain-containing protein n=1 Tax=Loa loa TaxID=7209 RepID=A0A1I7VIK6_LOALO|nr:hypothetical protein LOAG_12900 [Loa loa]EFO15610.1 hypothetical protein LOAG_12900 [Loa loa]
MAHSTLTELLPSVSLPEVATATYPADTTDPDDHADDDSDLLYLYDRITSSDQSPVFVAADLNILPLQLIIDKDDSKSELLREIRQLKRFIQDALNGRVDEPPITQADSGVQTINEAQSDCDPHGQSSSGYCLASPKSSFKSSTNASTSSPELPASTSSISSTPCSSLIPTTMASPVSPYHHPENNQTITGLNSSILGGTLTLNDNISLSNGSNRDGTSTSSITTIGNHNRRKRDGCGNRLDAMVRKLANRQKEKEAAAAAAAILASGSACISMCSGSTISTISSVSSSLSPSLSSSTTTTATSLVIPPEQSSPPAKGIWHTQMIDPVAYVNMLRTMSGAAAAAAAAATAISSPSSIFPSINKTMQNDR